MNIKSIRKELGLSQRLLAEKLGLGKNGYRTIQRLENGKKKIHPNLVKKLNGLLEK